MSSCVQLQGAEPDGPPDGVQVEVGGESYLTRLYGRAPYEGVRRTLKKSPYLRFSSPGSPLGRKPRPRLVESVRGHSPFCRTHWFRGSGVSFPVSCLFSTRCEGQILQDSDIFGSSPHSPTWTAVLLPPDLF